MGLWAQSKYAQSRRDSAANKHTMIPSFGIPAGDFDRPLFQLSTLSGRTGRNSIAEKAAKEACGMFADVRAERVKMRAAKIVVFPLLSHSKPAP